MSSESESFAFSSHWEQKGIANAYTKVEAANAGAIAALIKKSGIFQDATNSAGPMINILDGACGTGIVSSQLYQLAVEKGKDISITCGDLSNEMVEFVEERRKVNGWKNVTVKVIDSQDTKLPNDHFDYVFVSLAIMLMPKPFDALQECLRITKPGGTITFSCINRAGWVSNVSKALENVPGASTLPKDFPREIWMKTGNWHDPTWIQETLTRHQFPQQFQDIHAELYEHSFGIQDLEDYMVLLKKVLLPGVINFQGWSEEQQAERMPLLEKELRKIFGGIVDEGMTYVYVVAKKAN